MCGIVGVVGHHQTTEILLNGLDKLAYRGYDSAGIYVADSQTQDYLVKQTGKVSKLRAAVDQSVVGTIGIGHTRWATHGGATIENAHPHYSTSQRFYLVHNGVITNYEALKATYLNDVVLNSQTDTEIIVQMIAKFVEVNQMTTKSAFLKVLNLLEGSYALGLIDHQQPEMLYVAKNQSPLLIGVGDGFNVICSDALAMLEQTQNYIALADQQIALLTAATVVVENLNGEKQATTITKLAIDVQQTQKGAYEHYMLKEIDEQPAVMRRLISEYDLNQTHYQIDKTLLEAMNAADCLYIIAAGTSYHAGLMGKSFFEKLVNIPVQVHVASEFGYHMPLLSQKPFFIYLTQSGETADSRQVLVQTKNSGYPSLTITNAKDSTLAREADFVLLLHAGPEIAVASTKAYTSQMAVQLILAVQLASAKGITVDFDLGHELGILATFMESLVSQKNQIENLVKDYLLDQHDAFYLGRGKDYALSLEAALKLKEIAYIHTEGFAAGELKHGTLALIEDKTPIIAFLTDEKTIPQIRSNIQEVKARGANVITIVSADYQQADDQIVLPQVNDYLRPLLAIIPAQLIAYYASLLLGYDVDQPRNLAKSVTVE